MATGDWLLLQLPSTPEGAPTWLATDVSGALLPDVAAQADLPTAAAGRQVALVAPAGDVALFNVQLPAGNEARLQQLAPFALEEQVTDDLDALHFAVGARDAATGLVPVAVAARTRMQEWLATAAAMGIRPRALYAEDDLAPMLPGHVTMVIAPDHLVLRDGVARPVSFPADDPQLALSVLLGARPHAEVHLVVHADPLEWPRHEAAIEALRPQLASLRVQLVTGGLLSLHAQGMAASAPVNLLQGPFRQQVAAANDWRRWRTAALLLVGLLLLHAAGSLWELRQARAASAALDAEIEQVYGAIFPGQRPGPTPLRAIEARMRAVGDGGSPAGELMPLLAAVSAARQNVPVATLDAIAFKPGELQLKLSAPDATTLEQFSQALRAGGYGAQVSSGRQHEGGFEGQIDMTAGGS